MLTFSFVRSSGQAAKYYEQTDDYYTKEGHIGEWQGAGAAEIGLSGGVDPKTFKSLLDGRLPDGTQVRKVAPRTAGDGKKAQARLGIDFTFSAPKSVSIVALVNHDRRVIDAHNAAVADALKMLETKVVARHKIKGVSHREHTNKMVSATFQHDLSRDQDPQLHTHAVTMNLTQRADGRWTALENEEMLKGVKVVGAYYRARLAHRLEEMGYELRATRDGFEMASIPDEAIKLFSQRSKSIETQLAEKGLTRDEASGAMKQTVTKLTRKAKDEGDRAALRQDWLDRLGEAGITIAPSPGAERAPRLTPEPPPGHDGGTSVPAVQPSPGQPNAESNRPPQQSRPNPHNQQDAQQQPNQPNAPQQPPQQQPSQQSPADRAADRPVDRAAPEQSPAPTARPEPSPSQRAPEAPREATRAATGADAPDNREKPGFVQQIFDAVRDRLRPNDSSARGKGTEPAHSATGGDNDPPPPRTDEERARAAVNFAIEHLTERQGIFTKSELQERAYMRALGVTDEIDRELERAKQDGRLVTELPLFQSAKSFSRDEQKKSQDATFDKFRHDNENQKLTRESWVNLLVQVERYTQERAETTVDKSIAAGRLVPTEERYTTPEMRSSELAVLRMEREGRGAVTPIKTVDDVRKMLESTDLNTGQREAVELILTTDNRVVGVQGFAGVGKSHMLSKAVNAIKSEAATQAANEGYTVIGLAPYGSQNRALNELGMDSQTLASFLVRKSDQEKLGPKTIVVLDEASVVPGHQMEHLIRLVEQSDARLVLLGDRKQTQAVEAGKPFEQLQDAGMKLAHITEIQRQKPNPELLAAVERAAIGRIEGAVNKLDSRSIEIRDPEARHDAIAKAYVDLPQDERNKTLIVVGSNAARRNINAKIRDALDLKGGDDVLALESYDLTRAEHKQASSYTNGVILIAEKPGRHGLKRGEQYTVVGVDAPGNRVTVKHPTFGTLNVNASKLAGVSTYQPATIKVAPGDWLRVTRNNSALDIYNGERFRVSAVEKDAVVLENGARLSRDGAMHIQHGYAQTVHSAQGLTRSRVLIDADTKSLTSNRATFYVAISRPTHHLTIYTDNKGNLARSMGREPKKYAALELRGQYREAQVFSAVRFKRTVERNVEAARARDRANAGTRAADAFRATARPAGDGSPEALAARRAALARNITPQQPTARTARRQNSAQPQNQPQPQKQTGRKR
ncbi:TPA: MobF family relaxase [Burkholderia cepacia]